jgi:TPR repeat protein
MTAEPLNDALVAEGRGDYATALQIWRTLADQGDPAGQYRLGLMYYDGRGVPQNYAEAAKWFHLAVNQGNAAAKNLLGAMYANGWGVQQDYVRAFMWFDLAAAQGGGEESTKYRDLVAQHMTAAQIAEAQKLAREWKPNTPSPSR